MQFLDQWFPQALAAVLQWLPLVILVAIPLVMIIRDPRRMRCALLSTFWALLALQYLLADAVKWIAKLLELEDMTYLTLGALVLGFLMVLGVAFFLVWAGIVLLRREGISIAHSLSLILGFAILGYLTLVLLSVFRSLTDLAFLLIMLGVPILLFSYVLISYILYSAVYGFVTKRWGRSGQATVVLGSGLIGDRVPPLLARRVDLGVVSFQKSWSHWDNPALVMSGGQGSDEATSEGAAMMLYAEQTYALLQELPEGAALLVEDKSVNTEQNLLFSTVILEESGRSERWTVVTSNFHAFRAANLMSRLGIRGNAIGAGTRSYFWASAKLREFAAILAMNKKMTIFFAVASFIPFLIIACSRIFG